MAKLIESNLNQILQAQTTKQVNAEYYKRTDIRKRYRNGTYPLNLLIRVGNLTLKVPHLHNEDFSTDLFTHFQRGEQALHPQPDGNVGELLFSNDPHSGLCLPEE